MENSKNYLIKVNTRKENKLITELRKKIKSEVIGQDKAIRWLLRATAAYYSGLKDPRRPIAGIIFAGPTGVGKTFTAKVFARYFLGGGNKYRDYLTRIDGSTLNERHEVSKLKGAPPGYLGYGDLNLLAQENIDAYHFDVKLGNDDGSLARQLRNLQGTKNLLPPISSKNLHDEKQARMKFTYNIHKPYCSVILFDEIEKAHQSIWNLLLQIMEEGKIQMGESDKETNFADSVIILTTNIGQRNIQEMLKINPSRTDADRKDLDNRIYSVVKEDIKKKLPPELFRRLDLVVFRPLKGKDFSKILDNFLLEEKERLNEKTKALSRFPINIKYTLEAKGFLLEKGIDIYYGARTLRAVVEKYVRAQVANGIASGEISPGDELLIDKNKDGLVFFRKARKKGPRDIGRRPLKLFIEEKSK